MKIGDYKDAMEFFKNSRQLESNGKWKEFVDKMEFEDMVQEPRTMAQEPRLGLQGGQLVQNTDDGSRPGYKGDDTVVDRTVLRYKYDKSTKQKLETIYKNIQEYKDIKTFRTADKEAEIITRLKNFASDFKEATGRLPVRNEIRSFGAASQSVMTKTYLKKGVNYIEPSVEMLKSKSYVYAFTPETPIVNEVFDLYDQGMSKKAISEKLKVDRTKLRSWFHKWRPEDIRDKNEPSGKGKWQSQKKYTKILAELKKELKGMEGGKAILAKMEAHLDDIWNKNDEILAMSDQQILKSKKIKQAMNLDVKGLKIGEGLNYNRYKNLSDADYVNKVIDMAETHQFYQPEHLIAINKKNVASLLPENIVSVSGKIGSQMETLKNYVTKNPKDKFVSQIDELFKSQGIPSSSNIIKLNKQMAEKFFKNKDFIKWVKKFPCMKADGGTPDIACHLKGMRHEKNLLAEGKGSRAIADKFLDGTKLARKGGTLKTVLGVGGILGDVLFEGAYAAYNYTQGKDAADIWKHSWYSFMDPSMWKDGKYVGWVADEEKRKQYEIRDEDGNVTGIRKNVKRYYDNVDKVEQQLNLFDNITDMETMDARGYDRTKAVANAKKALSDFHTSLGPPGGMERIYKELEYDRPYVDTRLEATDVEKVEDKMAAFEKMKEEGGFSKDKEYADRFDKPTHYKKRYDDFLDFRTTIFNRPTEPSFYLPKGKLHRRVEDPRYGVPYATRGGPEAQAETGAGIENYLMFQAEQAGEPITRDEAIKLKWQLISEGGGFDLMDKIGIAGGVSKMADGGLTRTVAPDSEGIMSLKKW